MKLKIIIILLLSSISATAQTWNWRTPDWKIYVSSNINNIPQDFPSPFNSPNNLNVANLLQPDDPITGLPKNDWNPEDGWVLLKKNLGTPLKPVSDPSVVLYNKHTAVIRVFFLVVQQFSANSSGTPGAKDANVTVTFFPINGGTYQPNLFVNTSPLQPLDVFVDKNTTIVPNYYRNNIPYWLFADIPVSYDPCTSIAEKPGYLTITMSLLQSANLEFTLLAQPFGATPITNDNVDPLTDFSTALNGKNSSATLGLKTLSGGIKLAKTAGEVLDKFSKATEQHSNLVRKTKLRDGLTKLSTGLGTAAKWASLVPVYGEVASSVLSLIDVFTGGGSDSNQPGGTVILNDFKANGSITSTTPLANMNIAIPGVPRSVPSAGVATPFYTDYNNTLGIFNLLYTPEQTTYRQEYNQPSNVNVSCNGYSVNSYAVKRIRQDYVKFKANDINEMISYVVNPALDIDLENSDILFSLQTVGRFRNTNLIDEGVIRAKNMSNQIDDVNIYRTEYYPIKQAKDITVFRETLLSTQLGDIGAVIAELCVGNLALSYDERVGSVTDEWTVKIVARLKRRGKDRVSDDLIFIGTYPVKLANVSSSFPPSIGNPYIGTEEHTSDFVNDYYDQAVQGSFWGLPFIQNLEYPLLLRGGRISNVPNNNFVINAPLITLLPERKRVGNNPFLPSSFINVDLVIQPSAGGDVILGGKNTTYQPPVSSANIVTFCGGAKYKISDRYTLRTVAPPEEPTSPSTQPKQDFEKTEFLTAFPNPTTGETTIRYEVAKEGSSIEVFVSNMLGERVATLTNAPTQGAGVYEVTFDAGKLANGIYIYTLIISGERISKKLVVSK